MDLADENRIREIVREELANFTPQKKKRAPNKWQIFLKTCTKSQPDNLSYPEKVKQCSAIYKKDKNNGIIDTQAIVSTTPA